MWQWFRLYVHWSRRSPSLDWGRCLVRFDLWSSQQRRDAHASADASDGSRTVVVLIEKSSRKKKLGFVAAFEKAAEPKAHAFGRSGQTAQNAGRGRSRAVDSGGTGLHKRAVDLRWDKLPACHCFQKTWRFRQSMPGWKPSPRGIQTKTTARWCWKHNPVESQEDRPGGMATMQGKFSFLAVHFCRAPLF